MCGEFRKCGFLLTDAPTLGIFRVDSLFFGGFFSFLQSLVWEVDP